MTKQRVAKILDELLVLFDLYHLDYNVIDDALYEISLCRRNNPHYPITASLHKYMVERGYLEE